MSPRPFELGEAELQSAMDAMVDATFSDLQSHFLFLPRGHHFVAYEQFQAAYEVLKRHTRAFSKVGDEVLWAALREDALALVVLRAILGFSPPEWAELAESETGCEIPQGVARALDTRVRGKRDYLSRQKPGSLVAQRVAALLATAGDLLTKERPHAVPDLVHRLAKFDTQEGLSSLQHAAAAHVPYAMLLYERFLGRPFASHRDSVSEIVGQVMENAVEQCLQAAQITFRPTKRAERVPGFAQAPDFFVPDEVAPAVVIEAKIAGDDGTARDKVARILRLAQIRDARATRGESAFELVACVDGRGFGVRRQDMCDMLAATKGKVFTLATLNCLVENTALKRFAVR